MPDTSTAVPLPSATPEAVAFRLMELIAAQEGKYLQVDQNRGRDQERPDRSWILHTYAKCVQVVRTGYHED